MKTLMDAREQMYIRLTRQQATLLDFLQEQKTAAIHGPAGTDKTMIALKKAKRLSADGRRVPLLCYNRLLRDTMVRDNADPLISIHSIFTLAY